MASKMAAEPARLLTQARGGSDAALGLLLESYNSYLTLLARVQIGRHLQGKIDPADAVQDTFLEAHRQFDRFRGHGEAAFVRWLREILATRLAICMRRYLGTKRRDVRLERALNDDLDRSSQALSEQLISTLDSPSKLAARRERAVLLADALSRLPEDYRRAIELRHLEELPSVEISRRLQRSEDSVQKLLVLGLARLRWEIGDVY
jgi:RNA polymerase sigma-70 factor (ECF subfamily)